VILMDGAITVGDLSGGQKTTFADVDVPSTVLSAKFLLGVGDGESNLTDGALELNGDNVPLPSDGTHYRSSAGPYWDARTYDVKELLTPGSKTVEWEQNYAGDCLAFAFSALAFQASIVDADADDVDDSLDNCSGVKNPDQADSDSDGLGDLCDNCPQRANKAQGDEDNDGTGNICDTCPQLANPDNLDTDADGWGDACDTCASVANPDQIRPEVCPDVSAGGSGSGGETSGSAGEPTGSSGTDVSSKAGESNGGEAPGGSGKGGTKSTGGATSSGATSSEAGADDEDGNASASDAGGCGCAMPGSSGRQAKLFVLALAALAGLRRRSRMIRSA
jgi:MYXO-CTERM domain-containing protein